MNKEVLHTALIALGAFAAVYFVQKSMNFPIPIVGVYLPGGA
jgi:hypothetical protein